MKVGKVLEENHRKTQSLLARTSQSRGTELSWQMLLDFVEVMGEAPGTGLGEVSEGSRVRKDFSVEMTFELISER